MIFKDEWIYFEVDENSESAFLDEFDKITENKEIMKII